MNYDVIAKAKQIVFESDLESITKALAGMIIESFEPDAEVDAVDKLVRTHTDEQLEEASAAAEMAIYEAKRAREDFILVNGSAEDIEMLNLEYENMQKQLELTIAKIEEKFNKGEVVKQDEDTVQPVETSDMDQDKLDQQTY